MPNRNRATRLEQFLKQNPICCLCGGTRPATSREHAPPRVMFVDKQRPKGIEVPACDRCNLGTANADQLAAFFCFSQALSLLEGKAKKREFRSFKKVLTAVANNNQSTQKFFTDFGTMFANVNGVFRPMRKVGINKKAVGDELNPWAVKQVLALWYNKTKIIVPENSVIFVRWFSLIEQKTNSRAETLRKSFPSFSTLSQGKLNADRQFSVRFKCETEFGTGQFHFSYHRSASFFALMFLKPEAADIARNGMLQTNFRQYSISSEQGIYEIQR